MSRETSTIEQFLPLRANWFHILVSLSDRNRHGYAVSQDVEERTQGAVKLWPATLYGSLRRMSEEGLITVGSPADDIEDDDPRRRYYALTELGRLVLEAEVERLESMARMARARQAARRTAN